MKSGGSPETSYRILEKENGRIEIALEGRLDVGNSAGVLKEIVRKIKKKPFTALTADLSTLSHMDEYGALVLLELKQLAAEKGGTFEMAHPGERIREVLTLFKFDSQEACAPPERTRPHFLVRVGESTIDTADNLRFMVAFLGSVTLAMLSVLRNPRSIRVDDTLMFMQKTGVEAIPIVVLISFLLGLIIAFMSSLQLEQFGASIYVASLVGLAMVSELGPIMTAIVVAGRSGSAFAAEIGTMKISEEVDALYVMGFDPTLFLAVPRIIAALIVVPVLTTFSNISGILGGLIIGIMVLDLTAASYISQTLDILTVFEIGWGTFKSVVFAGLIAWIGCLRGFQTRGGAASVGNAATSAVVTSIFFIILFDSIFAVVRSYVRY
jgi:phospholipid/cholesterol/gamma-HCH transport system permease protein